MALTFIGALATGPTLAAAQILPQTSGKTFFNQRPTKGFRGHHHRHHRFRGHDRRVHEFGFYGRAHRPFDPRS